MTWAVLFPPANQLLELFDPHKRYLVCSVGSGRTSCGARSPGGPGPTTGSGTISRFPRLQYAVDTAIVELPQPMQVPNSTLRAGRTSLFASASAQQLDPWSTCNQCRYRLRSLPALKDSTQNHMDISLAGRMVRERSLSILDVIHIVTLVQERAPDSMRLMGCLLPDVPRVWLISLPWQCFRVVLRLNVVFVSSLLLVTMPIQLPSQHGSICLRRHSAHETGRACFGLCFLGAFICGAFTHPSTFRKQFGLATYTTGLETDDEYFHLGGMHLAKFWAGWRTQIWASAPKPPPAALRRCHLQLAACHVGVLPILWSVTHVAALWLPQCCVGVVPRKASTPVLEQIRLHGRQAHGPHAGQRGRRGIGGHEALESGARGRSLFVCVPDQIYPRCKNLRCRHRCSKTLTSTWSRANFSLLGTTVREKRVQSKPAPGEPHRHHILQNWRKILPCWIPWTMPLSEQSRRVSPAQRPLG